RKDNKESENILETNDKKNNSTNGRTDKRNTNEVNNSNRQQGYEAYMQNDGNPLESDTLLDNLDQPINPTHIDLPWEHLHRTMNASKSRNIRSKEGFLNTRSNLDQRKGSDQTQKLLQ
ncbi:29719_t:CDS:2, partial [Racocetra persica]